MLRYIIGISILTIGIIIVRALSNGKVLRKHQYAFWIVIPLYMILMPFIKIDIPVVETIDRLFSSGTEIVSSVEENDAAPAVIVEAEHVNQVDNGNRTVVHEEHDDPGVIPEYQQIPVQNEWIPDNKANENIKIDSILKQISLTVSAVLIVFLITYNFVFISYCRRNRKYIGRDPESGLRIYSIRHKEAPFLLFNKIYIDNESEKICDFTICHEACHFKHCDYLWVLIRYLVLFINWYNPIIWTAFVLSGYDCELACDEEVMTIYGADSSKDYARTLLGLLQQQSDMAIGFSISTGMRSGYEMMKKRIISIKKPAKMSRKALGLSMASILLFTSCSFVNTSKNVREVSVSDPWWNDTEIVITPDDIKHELNKDLFDLFSRSYVADEDSVLIVFQAYIKNSNNDVIIRRYSYEGTMLGQVKLSDYFGDEEFYAPETLYKLNDKYYAVIQHYDEQKASLVSKGYEIDFDGSTLRNPFSIELPDDGLMFSNVLAMVGVDDKMVYLMSASDFDQSKYKICISNGQNVVTYTPDFGNDADITFISNLVKFKNGVSFTADVDKNGVRKVLYCTLDIDSLTLHSIELDSSGSWSTSFIPDCGVFEFTRNYESIEKVDTETWERKTMLSFKDTYIHGQTENLALVWVTDERVVLFAEDQGPTGGMSTTHLIVLNKADENPNAGKKILKFAYLESMLPHEYSAVNAFNRSSDKYFIETDSKYYDVANGIFYEEGWEYDLAKIVASDASAVDLLKSDIRAGEGPDLVMYGSDSAQLNNPDYLIDLTKRINSEKGLNNGDYMEFVTKPNARDGKHYRLDYNFSSVALTVNNSYIESGSSGITFDQYNDLINEYNSGTSILYKNNLALMKLLMENTDSLSYDTDGKIELENASFRATNEFIASIPDNMPNDDMYWTPKKKIQLVDGMNFSGFVYLYGDVYMNYSIIGLPSSDGHAEVIKGRGIGITTCCPLQDGAWEFAMMFMSPDFQNQVNTYYDPVLKSAQKIAFEKYVDIKNSRRNPYVSSDIPLQKDIVDYYIDQISDAVVVPDMDSGIIVIMNEEMPAYYCGQKSLDDVIEIVEKRVNLMFSEQG